MAALEAALLDRGGNVYSLDAYAEGTTLNDGAGDPDAAFGRVLTAIAATLTQSGIIQLGMGTYKAPSGAVVFPSNVTIRGLGPGLTTLKHRDSTNRGALWLDFTVVTTNFVVCDLTIDGNKANNQDYAISELSIEATGTAGSNVDCAVVNVEFKNHNATALACGGTRPTVSRCRFNGGATSSYSSILDSGPTPTRYGGLYGAITSA
jgi:hypothetical protein